MEIAYPAGQSLRVGDLQGFPQGFSAELLTFDLTYEKDGAERTEGMVVRIEPNEKYQLFLDTNFEEQYRVMEALGRHTATPVPRTVGFESNREFLGARFYVMEKACGETGQIGLEWVSAIGEEGREMLWWNGLAAMAEMHRADPERLRLDFLEQPERGSDPIDQQLHYYWEYYNWVRGGESYPIIEVALEWLQRSKPLVLPPKGIVWGDARRGNQLFTSDFACSAILDFEQVCLGPAEVDLAWWLEGEHQTSEWMGMSAPTVEETTSRYAKLLGREIADIGYYMVFASLRLAVLRIKLSILREGQPDRAEPDAGIPRLANVLARYAGIEARIDR
ncbi:Predicted kinase, aminoglycoside phosphotransferase (APT) family [Rhodococcus koreensis]|uniref:Predicted kinase, aminoglycoside phosphotransferase (APT) family n=2 Tax=Rhodococcus koreensis TaxID=99653 RepID=A0A1H4L2I6_9NOCA|nr:Predicted kinase, aminoglycoside phosphotransferase (APT) family [Rhodococcus koreensis]